ncbi:MAG: hypothetical protein J7M26_01250 [Armatimonadetes bacterium]|nr:hypothetical protein [Armatimonadota bacterium]
MSLVKGSVARQAVRSLLVIAVFAVWFSLVPGVVLANDYDCYPDKDYGDAPGYDTAYQYIDVNDNSERLGNDYSGEYSPRNEDTYDDGVAWVPDTLVQGETFDLTLTGYAWHYDRGDYVRVWIDWDQDGDWENNEMIVDTTVYGDSDDDYRFSLTSTYTVPDDAALGTTWMRVRMSGTVKKGTHSHVSAPGPYGGYCTYGEVEDYPVEVSPTPELSTIILLLCSVAPALVLRRRRSVGARG